MEKVQADLDSISSLLQEMSDQQKKFLLTVAQRIVPTVIADDLLQPNDFLELENHAAFRYEEGVLAGLLSAQMALQALRRELEVPS